MAGVGNIFLKLRSWPFLHWVTGQGSSYEGPKFFRQKYRGLKNLQGKIWGLKHFQKKYTFYIYVCIKISVIYMGVWATKYFWKEIWGF